MRLNGGLGLRRAALAGVIAVGLAGCGSVTEAAGRVVDPAGRPVAGALVLLRRAGQAPRGAQFAERADRTGGFHAILHGGYFPPDAVLSVCAPGFVNDHPKLPTKRHLKFPTGVTPLLGMSRRGGVARHGVSLSADTNRL